MTTHEPTGNESSDQLFKPNAARQRHQQARWRRVLRRLSNEAAGGVIRGASSAAGTAVVAWAVVWYQNR